MFLYNTTKQTRGYMNEPKCMTNTYYTRGQTWKLMKMLSFHLLRFTILNSIAILTSCGSNLSDWQRKLCITGQGHNMKRTKGEWTSDHEISKTNPLPSANHKHMKHNTTNTGPWKEKEFDGTSVPPKTKKIRWEVKYPECKAGLCTGPCFKINHNELHFGRVTTSGNFLRLDIPLCF
jgi:hypothetical protein